MIEAYATLVFLFVLFTLLGSSIWIGLALMGVAWVGMELFTLRPAGDAMITTIWTGGIVVDADCAAIVIWMGEILYRTRLSQDMFRGLAPWMRWLPGGCCTQISRVAQFCCGFRIISGDTDHSRQNVDPGTAQAWLSRIYDRRHVGRCCDPWPNDTAISDLDSFMACRSMKAS